MHQLSRRTFLVAGTGAVALAACGSSSKQSNSPGTKDPTDVASTGAYELVGRFAPGSIVTGIPQRIVISLVNADGSGVSQGPETFTGQFSLEGKDVGGPVTMQRRAKDLPSPYWAAPATFDTPGSWVLTATFPDGTKATKAFSVVGKAASPIPNVGDKLIAVETPTTADKHGVDPICTRQPACPFHDVTLTAAMAAGTPIALLIGTPAYCQTGVCGPVLDLVIAQQAEFGSKIKILHGEVYATAYTGADTATTPVVQAYQLDFEPYLVVADSTGVIKQRLDVIWDAEELRAALSSVV